MVEVGGIADLLNPRNLEGWLSFEVNDRESRFQMRSLEAISPTRRILLDIRLDSCDGVALPNMGVVAGTFTNTLNSSHRLCGLARLALDMCVHNAHFS